MLKIIMLGLVLAAAALSGAVIAAGAETVPSPLQQVRDGTPAGKVDCADGRVLMESRSGMPVCVFAGSVDALERRGFVTLSGTPSDDLLAEQPGTSEKDGGAISAGASKTGDRPFVATWQTISPNESITVPVGGAVGAYTVDWGDGSTSANVTGDQSHAYEGAGTYTVAITGNFERIYLNGDPDNAPKIQSIEQWGNVSWTSMNSAFEGASNMIYNATDIPDLSGVTDMSCMFAGAIRFDGDLSGWDVSKIKNMSCMFAAQPSFDDEIRGNRPFSALPTVFNGDLSKWDVSNVTDMSYMFNGSPFNGDISAWDVSGVTDMSYMFNGSPFNGDISVWDVSSVTSMTDMFYNSAFNGDISAWDVSSVTDMYGMFWDSPFNGDISAWDVSSVTSMHGMFARSPFNGDISAWDVSSVTSMHGMFASSPFNGDISAWDVSSVTSMTEMFRNSAFNGDISAWDVSSVIYMFYMFNDSPFNGDISAWDVSSVTSMHGMFASSPFNGDISSWDVSSATDMSGTFSDSSFNGNLGRWYITLDNTSIAEIPGMVGNIVAQNLFLDNHNPIYGTGSGADSALFEIDGGTLLIKLSANYSGKTEYAVNITSTGYFGVNNFRVINVTVAGAGDADPN